MLRWLERNGYDVSYFTGVDSDRFGERDPRARGLPVRRARRILVGRAARQRRGRPRRRRATSPSSAATRSTGRPAGSRARPTVAAPTTGRSSPTRKATPRAASTTTASGNFACDPDQTPGPGCGGRTRPATTADRPENSLSGQISWGDATTAIQVPAVARPAGSGATRG